jgi:hypothetical protein
MSTSGPGPPSRSETRVSHVEIHPIARRGFVGTLQRAARRSAASAPTTGISPAAPFGSLVAFRRDFATN